MKLPAAFASGLGCVFSGKRGWHRRGTIYKSTQKRMSETIEDQQSKITEQNLHAKMTMHPLSFMSVL